MKSTIQWADFEKIEMRVGTIIKVIVFEKARNPAFQVWVDFGEIIGIKKTSAQITKRYTPESLLHQQIIGILNFPVKQIANFQSEFLLLGATPTKDDVVIIAPEAKVENGTLIG